MPAVLAVLRFLLSRVAYQAAIVAVSLGAAGFTKLAARVLQVLTAARHLSGPGAPLPAAWREVISDNVHVAQGLTADERARLERLVTIFLHDVRFEGCMGLRVTDEMRVEIAAEACLLLLNLRFPWYPKLRRVLVYPDTFVPKTMPGATVERDKTALLGEAWTDGSVVLSWRSVLSSMRQAADGSNVVLHEFAHELDASDGKMDGLPPLEGTGLRTWAYVLHRHYHRLLRWARQEKPSTLDPYGATDEAEFFAVATEAFFERPKKVKHQEPELYEALRQVYHQDPAARAELRSNAA